MPRVPTAAEFTPAHVDALAHDETTAVLADTDKLVNIVGMPETEALHLLNQYQNRVYNQLLQTNTWETWNTRFINLSVTTSSSNTSVYTLGWPFAHHAGSTCNINVIQQRTWDAWNGIIATGGNPAGQRNWEAWVAQADITREERERRQRVHQEHLRVQAEAQQRQAERDRAWREEEAKRALKEQLASKRAEKLLLESLSAEQKKDFFEKKCFYLYSNGKKYRIRRGTHQNVDLVEEGTNRPLTQYCVVAMGGVPEGDAMLAQKLLLEADEATFLKLANAWDYNQAGHLGPVRRAA